MIAEPIKLLTKVDFPALDFIFDNLYFDYHGVHLYKSDDAFKLAKNLAQIAFPQSKIQILNARLHNMVPGVTLKEHVDKSPPDAEHFHVLHFPLKTNSEAFLAFGDTKYQLQQHHLYEFNYTLPHWGSNKGTEERIHLFIEVYAYDQN